MQACLRHGCPGRRSDRHYRRTPHRPSSKCPLRLRVEMEGGLACATENSTSPGSRTSPRRWNEDEQRWMHASSFTSPYESDLPYFDTDRARSGRMLRHRVQRHGWRRAAFRIISGRAGQGLRSARHLEGEAQERFGHILEAFPMAPSDGGIGPAIEPPPDVLSTSELPEVMAFPKMPGYDPLMDAPSTVDERAVDGTRPEDRSHASQRSNPALHQSP